MAELIDFYRLRGYDKDLWFTDVSPIVLSEWALENEIKFTVEIRLANRVGIMVQDKDKVMFELFWGANEKRASAIDHYGEYEEYYSDDEY